MQKFCVVLFERHSGKVRFQLMSIVTLTTDLGLSDHYVAVVKGELLKADSGVRIIDISHEIKPFDIAEAAFVLKNSYEHFPAGTYHIVGVNTQQRENMGFLVIEIAEQIFIGPDNGVFTLVFDELPAKIFRLKNDAQSNYNTFPMGSIMVNAFKHLSSGKNISEIAEATRNIQTLIPMHAIFNERYIRASVIHFDRFENAILNIRKKEFDEISRGRNFQLHFHRNDDIRGISRNYFDGNESEILCFFNSSGYLEMSMNQGNIGSLLGLRIGDTVQLEFK